MRNGARGVEVSRSNPRAKMDAGDASTESIPLDGAMLLACSGMMAIRHDVDAF